MAASTNGSREHADADAEGADTDGRAEDAGRRDRRNATMFPNM